MFGKGQKTADAGKNLSPKDAMAQQIDALESGKELVFRLGQIYVKPYITVLHNPEHPGKGKKFIAFQEGAGADGKPSGNRGKFYDTNNAKDFASWILEREGHLYEA